MPTANKLDCVKLKIDLEEYGRNLRFMWDFRNDERSFLADRFRPKSSFNPMNKDVITETYLSCLQERLLVFEIPSKRFKNFTKEEREALYSLKDDPSVVIKDNDKGSAVVVWAREDYLKKPYKHLDEKEVYDKSQRNPSFPCQHFNESIRKKTSAGGFVEGHS